MPGAEDATRAFALVLVDELVRHGVGDAVLAPGSRSTPLALALDEHPGVRLHVRIDERSAAYLAVGLIRGSGRPVPVLCTSGTATSYLLGAAMEADQSRLPLLLLTADRPPELRGVGANQTVDQVGMFGTAVRWAVDVGVPEARPDAVRYWRSLVSRAVAVATGASGGTSGPVHLNLPLREPLVPVTGAADFPFPLDGREDGSPWTTSPAASTVVPHALGQHLAAVRRGVVVAGDGLRPEAGAAVAAFAARAGWPLIAEPHSGARRGPTALRASDVVLRDEAFVTAHHPDLVVVAGRVQLSRTLLGWLATVPHVVVDRDGSWWDPTRTALAVARCDPTALADVEVDPAEPAWTADWVDSAARAAAAVDAVLDGTAELNEPRVARDVAASLPTGAALVVASSMPVRDLDLVMHPRDDIRVVANRGVSGIDGFVSTAQGVAATHPGPTYALCGDLSLLHDSTGLSGSGDVTYVVANNDGGGIFSLLPQGSSVDAAAFERLFGTPHGVDLEQLAAAYGVGYTAVAAAADLAAAAAEPPSGLRLVEVRTNRTANAALHEQLRGLLLS